MPGLYDPVTGLARDDLLDDRIVQCAARARRHGELAALMLIDLHADGAAPETLADEAARDVAEALIVRMRASDTAARIDATTFAVIQTELAQFEDAAILAGKVLEGLERLGHPAAIGIAVFPEEEDHPERLRDRAAAALAAARAEGPGTFHFHSDALTRAAAPHVRLARAIPDALARSEFALYYQPKVALPDQAVIGAEALIRWQHAVDGMLGPDHFVPVAEQTGYIRILGAWALEEACAAGTRWGGRTVAVNVSPMQLEERGFVDMVAKALSESGLPPGLLELEITEGALIRDPDTAAVLLARLSEMGVLVTVDDFGTGHSSLAYLSRFPVDKLKLDRNFVTDIDTNPIHAKIVRAVIGLGHSLGLSVVAEGVDRPDQLALLRAEGCDEAQGFLFGAPMKQCEFEERVGEG